MPDACTCTGHEHDTSCWWIADPDNYDGRDQRLGDPELDHKCPGTFTLGRSHLAGTVRWTCDTCDEILVP